MNFNFLNNLSLSINCIKIIKRNGNAGILYLTIAPTTGVNKPISKNVKNTKNKEKKNRFLFRFLNLIKRIEMIAIKIKNKFSKPLIRFNREVDSKNHGLKKV